MQNDDTQIDLYSGLKNQVLKQISQGNKDILRVSGVELCLNRGCLTLPFYQPTHDTLTQYCQDKFTHTQHRPETIEVRSSKAQSKDFDDNQLLQEIQKESLRVFLELQSGYNKQEYITHVKCFNANLFFVYKNNKFTICVYNPQQQQQLLEQLDNISFDTYFSFTIQPNIEFVILKNPNYQYFKQVSLACSNFPIMEQFYITTEYMLSYRVPPMKIEITETFSQLDLNNHYAFHYINLSQTLLGMQKPFIQQDENRTDNNTMIYDSINYRAFHQYSILNVPVLYRGYYYFSDFKYIYRIQQFQFQRVAKSAMFAQSFHQDASTEFSLGILGKGQNSRFFHLYERQLLMELQFCDEKKQYERQYLMQSNSVFVPHVTFREGYLFSVFGYLFVWEKSILKLRQITINSKQKMVLKFVGKTLNNLLCFAGGLLVFFDKNYVQIFNLLNVGQIITRSLKRIVSLENEQLFCYSSVMYFMKMVDKLMQKEYDQRFIKLDKCGYTFQEEVLRYIFDDMQLSDYKRSVSVWNEYIQKEILNRNQVVVVDSTIRCNKQIQVGQ